MTDERKWTVGFQVVAIVFFVFFILALASIEALKKKVRERAPERCPHCGWEMPR